ncbi:hypothetical protein A5739_14015 [Mycobacterium colombiense]|uniref:DUF1156 domain-containing protein n=1 Tax=Mycobacterium colombiense TaxID=339268 RepID=UPI00096E77F0|nr:DUF1156 domain-containing protein [Mycobacterium colombiense]OMC31130.1 hypothetical protein A5739_14015 [Mycobacterium colombiense]
MSDTTRKRKLIEVALPLEAINRESAHEKSVPRKGHPATLHLWWARRPLAAARALLFAQLVDDPSARPEEFPTEEVQRVERDRLHGLIQRLAKWENTTNDALMEEANAEILRSTSGRPPRILDPFAGGGTIPLEAQRLGLAVDSSELNPVAVLINKALIEIPPTFRDKPPVFPGIADSEFRHWRGSEGLAADVRAYGAWMRDEAARRIGYLYPETGDRKVIAWIWARTIVCTNPACSAEVPLISNLDLCKKKGRERWLRPVVNDGRVDFDIESGPRTAQPNKHGQGAKFSCWVCGGAITPSQVHAQLDVKTKPPCRLLAVVSAGDRRRIYSKPTAEDVEAADSPRNLAAQIRGHDSAVDAECRGTFGGNAQGRRYGFFTFSDYFTDRQLITMVTISDLVETARERVLADGGTTEYAAAIATYLAFLQSKLGDWLSSLCSWIPQIEGVRDTFARQAISMAWDFVEINPFSDSVGNLNGHFEWIVKALETLPKTSTAGHASQADAATRSFDGYLIATDPPYYDNISYSDLSDFFYVWLRRSLRPLYPELLATMLVPKAQELVANAYRHNGRQGAEKFFEDGFRTVFTRVRESADRDFPITVYYAFKQSESDDNGKASTGWETLLEGMVSSGWEITSTWPLRSERSGRTISIGTNALASAIVLSLRPRAEGASNIDRRGFIAALEAELPNALRKLQQGQIAPVDLPQAAIGPGMAVFSRYDAVLEPDGGKMSVRSALARINEILDRVLNEQEGDFDATGRFAIAWYRQYGYSVGTYGDAELLANARGVVVQALDRAGVLVSRAGKVNLIKPDDLASDYDVVGDLHTSNWEALHHLIKVVEREGIERAGEFLRAALSRTDGIIDADLIKELAHLLFRIAEGNGWTKDALNFNNLVTSWPDVLDAARAAVPTPMTQSAFEFDEDA